MKKILLLIFMFVFATKINALEIVDISKNTTVEQGNFVELKVEVQDDKNLKYQWYQSKTKNNVDFKKINNANNHIYNPPTYEIGKSYYYCEIMDVQEKITTKIIEVNVNKATAKKPTIIYEPVDINVGPNSYAILNIKAEITDGGFLSYTWYKKIDNKFVELENSNNSNYIVDTSAEGVFEYYCHIANTKFSVVNSVDSRIIKVNISKEYNNASEPIIMSQPQSIKKLANTVDIILSVEASSTDQGILSYQWYTGSTKKIDDMTAISGATTATYHIKEQENIKYYTVLITNKNGDAKKEIYSDVVSVEIVGNDDNSNKALAICLTILILSLVTYLLTIRKKKISN